MNVLLLAAVGYWLFVLVITFVHATQWADPNESVSWGGKFDWFVLLIAFTVGPYFIITGITLTTTIIWAGMMVMEGAGALLHLLDR